MIATSSSRSSVSMARIAAAALLLASTACSFSFKAGSSSGPDGKTGKPAQTEPDGGSDAPTTKPIADAGDDGGAGGGADPQDGGHDRPAQADHVAANPDGGTDPGDEPPPTVEPRKTAVCRVTDPTLEAMCHAVFDPIAADDIEAWVAQMGRDSAFVRPSHAEHGQRLRGPDKLRDAAEAAGGLRALLHLRRPDRIVGTVANDCRDCRRSFVAFEANTRVGTITIEVDMTQPPTIAAVVVAQRVQRQPLGEVEPRRHVDPPAVTERPTEPAEPPEADGSAEPPEPPTEPPTERPTGPGTVRAR